MRTVALRRALRTVTLGLVAAVSIGALLAGGDVAAGLAVATFASVPRTPDARANARDTDPTLIVFGDSLGQGFRATPGHGWVDLMRDRLALRDARSAVINASVGGSRVNDLRRQVATTPRTKVRAVFVVAGGNDLMSGTDPYSLARADVSLLREIRVRYPGARVIVANVPDISWRSFHLRPGAPAQPLPAPMRFGLGWLTLVDDAIVDRVARRAGADVLDLHRLTLEGDDETPGLAKMSLREFADRYVSPDGLHPNDLGYALLANFAWPLVARATRVRP